MSNPSLILEFLRLEDWQREFMNPHQMISKVIQLLRRHFLQVSLKVPASLCRFCWSLLCLQEEFQTRKKKHFQFWRSSLRGSVLFGVNFLSSITTPHRKSFGFYTTPEYFRLFLPFIRKQQSTYKLTTFPGSALKQYSQPAHLGASSSAAEPRAVPAPAVRRELLPLFPSFPPAMTACT